MKDRAESPAGPLGDGWISRMWTTVKDTAYSLYARRLSALLSGASLPRHVAIVMDGNRRWARQAGFADARIGHRYGAEHLDEVLRWCAELGIQHVTAFVASVDNLQKRDSEEVGNLLHMIEKLVAERLSRPAGIWRIHPAGRLDVLPDSTRHALKLAEEATRDTDTPFHLNIAIGYDGREEILNAIRSLLDEQGRAGRSITEIAEQLTPDQIATHLYTSGQPDPRPRLCCRMVPMCLVRC